METCNFTRPDVRGLLIVLLAAASLGCGATPAEAPQAQLQSQLIQPSAPAPQAAKAAPSVSPVTASPGPRPSTAAPTAPRTPALPLYQEAIKVYSALGGYSCHITVYGHVQGGVVGAGINVQFRQPRFLRMQIVDTNVLKGDATTLLYQGGDTVQVKAPGWAATPLSTGLNDPRLSLQDGQRYDGMTIGGILARFQAPGARIVDTGHVDWNGHSAEVFELHLADDDAHGIQKQLIGIELKQRYPLFAEQYGAGGLISQIVVDGLQPNPTFAPDAFSL